MAGRVSRNFEKKNYKLNLTHRFQSDGVYEQLPNYEEHLGVRKLVAGLISNCYFVKNDRLGYIHQLEKYMRIDLYGRCGNLTCPENCTTFLQQNYKFYLAFENCNCEDYVTEKFFMTAIL